MARLQPHIKKIQLDHKDNREEQAKRLIALYREHRLNPLSGFLLLLIQLPVLIAIYQIFLREITTEVFGSLSFLGILNLGERSLVLAVLAATLQYFQTKISLPKQNKNQAEGGLAAMAQMGRTMVIVGPVFTFFILVNFPAALGLYWTTSVLFSLGQQVIINKKLPKTEHDRKHTGDNKKHAGADGLQKDKS
jgi:YidC/Oxa1 family membrane protein insertase